MPDGDGRRYHWYEWVAIFSYDRTRCKECLAFSKIRWESIWYGDSRCSNKGPIGHHILENRIYPAEVDHFLFGNYMRLDIHRFIPFLENAQSMNIYIHEYGPMPPLHFGILKPNFGSRGNANHDRIAKHSNISSPGYWNTTGFVYMLHEYDCVALHPRLDHDILMGWNHQLFHRNINNILLWTIFNDHLDGWIAEWRFRETWLRQFLDWYQSWNDSDDLPIFYNSHAHWLPHQGDPSGFIYSCGIGALSMDGAYGRITESLRSPIIEYATSYWSGISDPSSQIQSNNDGEGEAKQNKISKKRSIAMHLLLMSSMHYSSPKKKLSRSLWWEPFMIIIFTQFGPAWACLHENFFTMQSIWKNSRWTISDYSIPIIRYILSNATHQ